MDAQTISERYIAECKKDMEMMNVKPATVHPKATEEICGMQEMIETLIEKGHAYTAKDEPSTSAPSPSRDTESCPTESGRSAVRLPRD